MPTGIYDRTKSKPNTGIFKKGHKLSKKSIKKMKISLQGKTKGYRNGKWKGGKSTCNGYNLIINYEHPWPSINNYIYEHRDTIEKIIGRYLYPREQVHHINKNKIDNKPSNLIAFNSFGAHRRFEYRCKPHPKDRIIFDGRIWLKKIS